MGNIDSSLSDDNNNNGENERYIQEQKRIIKEQQ